MWQENLKTRKAKELLWSMLEPMQRGDMLTHEAIEKATGVTRRMHSRYYALVDRIRLKLEEERGMTLVVQPLVGYLVASAKEQLESARFRNRKMARQARRAYRTVACLPMEDCNALEQKAKYAMEEKFAATERQLRQDSQRMAFLMRPRDPSPRIVRDDEEQQESA